MIGLFFIVFGWSLLGFVYLGIGRAVVTNVCFLLLLLGPGLQLLDMYYYPFFSLFPLFFLFFFQGYFLSV